MKGRLEMNISGITSTAQLITANPAQTQAQAPEQLAELSADLAAGAAQDTSPVALGVEVSARVLGMAQDVVEAAAAQLLDSMASVMTGVGRNIDIIA